MRKDIKLMTLGAALLLLAACTQDDTAPGALSEDGIELTPAVGLAAGWSAGTTTRADQKVPVTLAAGGKIMMFVAGVTADDKPDNATMQANYFEVTADGKLSRLPFSGEAGETEDMLNVPAAGQYFVGGAGEANLTTEGITYRAYIGNDGTKVTIGGNGKVAWTASIMSGALRLNIKGTDGAAYAGADVSATLKTVTQYENGGFEVKTLTAAAPSVIWGDIDSGSSVAAGTQLLELVVDGTTYKVSAPRQISFTDGRLYTFNVRVGATGITVSSDDLSIGDFEVQASTGTEADIVHYKGMAPHLLAIPGCTAYWVAPENAAYVDWASVDLNTICPAGWHVPTKDEFLAMTGLPSGESESENNFAAISAVFPDAAYRSTTVYDMTISTALIVNSVAGKASVANEENDGMVIRCVRKK